MPRKNKHNSKHTAYVKPDYHSQNKNEEDEDNKKKLSKKERKKIKLRTSWDVYKRLIHDPSLGIDLNYVYIGYSDKVLGNQEMPLLEWTMIDDGGDIPMHHILYFILKLLDGQQIMIWDRKTRLDRLYCSGATNKNTQSLKLLLLSIDTKNIPKYKKKHYEENMNDDNHDNDDDIDDEKKIDDNNEQQNELTQIEMLDELISIFSLNRFKYKINLYYNKKRIFQEPQINKRLKRNDYRIIAASTQKIMDKGEFINIKSNKTINLSNEINFSYDNAELYHEQNAFKYINIDNNNLRKYTTMDIEIMHETTLDSAYRLISKYGENINLCLLNFSSAKNIGGGWDNGANAQEESIARSSTLVHSLEQFKSQFYEYHKLKKTMLYSHALIYSPGVVVMKHGNGEYIDKLNNNGYYKCNMVTSPAVNAGYYIKRAKENDIMMIKYGNIRKGDKLTNNERELAAQRVVEHVMKERCKRVLELAMKYNNEYLVLGAWGCGVFRNDPQMIANIFANLLKNRYRNTFKKVVFAILDCKKKQTLDKFVMEFDKTFKKESDRNNKNNNDHQKTSGDKINYYNFIQ